LDDHASANVALFAALEDRGCGVIILKILAAWTLVSVFSSFAIAPALSRRLRDINFPAEDEWRIAMVTMRRPLAVNSNMKSRLQNAARLEAAGKPAQRLEL
jgi:hypothetical protein